MNGYILDSAQVALVDWTPKPWLNATPVAVKSGDYIGWYAVDPALNDPNYSEAQEFLAALPDDPVEIWVMDLYELWEIGKAYEQTDIVRYLDYPYECIQSHTSQADWTPDVVPALWALDATLGGTTIPEWTQPAGAHDAYQTGDKVTHNGFTWESDIDANVWAPGVYGWTQI